MIRCEQVYEELENTTFPKTSSRKNISDEPIEAFVLGQVNYRGQEFLDFKTRGPSRYNKKFPQLFKLLKKFMQQHDPQFKYTTIQLNKNIISPPHIDKNNVGPSYIIALGDYKNGGDLVVEGKPHNIKNKFFKFDGTKGHWVTPFSGTRYSLVFFTHTFKPPNPSLRYLEVKEDGLYRNGILVKSYKSPDTQRSHPISPNFTQNSGIYIPKSDKVIK